VAYNQVIFQYYGWWLDMDRKASEDTQAVLDYVAKLKNNGDLEALSLKQRFKCYGVISETAESSAEIEKVNHWLNHRAKKVTIKGLREGQISDCLGN
jgi:hypothetical protein